MRYEASWKRSAGVGAAFGVFYYPLAVFQPLTVFGNPFAETAAAAAIMIPLHYAARKSLRYFQDRKHTSLSIYRKE